MRIAKKRPYQAKSLRLSNLELAAAIAFMSDVLATVGTASARYAASKEHYETLLKEQAKRATQPPDCLR